MDYNADLQAASRPIASNDLKKGDLITLKNGWKARIEDNKKGNTRLATVYGLFEEMGSIYVWDIAVPAIELTPKQQKTRGMVKALGF